MNTKYPEHPRQTLPMDQEAEERQVQKAIRELERMERSLNRKKDGDKPRHRRAYADHR